MKYISKNKLRSIQIVLLLVVVVVVGASLSHSTYAATGSLTLSPGNGSHNKDDTFTVTVTENSGTDPANTVDAMVTYPSTLLDFLGSTTVAPFTFNPTTTDAVTNGVIHITRSQLGTSSTGAQVVTVLTFKAKATGSAIVGFDTATSDILSANDSSNLLTSSPSVTYTIVTPPPTGGGTTGGGSTGGNTSNPTPATTPATNTNTKSTSTTVKASGSGVTVPNNGTVAVTTPVTVQPATIQTDGVKKIEYYLNGKLVDTETNAPYTYKVDTTQLKGGTYTLLSKTYYSNGTTKDVTQHIQVKNTAKKVEASNVGISIALIMAIVVGLVFAQHRRHQLLPAAFATPTEKVVTSMSPGATAPSQPIVPAVSAIPPLSGKTPTPGSVIQHTNNDDQTKTS